MKKKLKCSLCGNIWELNEILAVWNNTGNNKCWGKSLSAPEMMEMRERGKTQKQKFGSVPCEFLEVI